MSDNFPIFETDNRHNKLYESAKFKNNFFSRTPRDFLMYAETRRIRLLIIKNYFSRLWVYRIFFNMCLQRSDNEEKNLKYFLGGVAL